MIKQEDTICFGVDEAIEDIQKMVATGLVDPVRWVNRLHHIREQAQHMENALKARKARMIEAGIEESYQKSKGIEKDAPKVNEIGNKEEYFTENRVYEIIINENGKVIWQGDALAGVVCLVDKITDIGKNGVEGRSQRFTFGHDLAWWFAFDQLSQVVEDKRFAIGMALATAQKDKGLLKKLLKIVQVKTNR